MIRRMLHRKKALVLIATLVACVLVPVLANAAPARTVEFSVYSSDTRKPLYQKFFDAFTEKTGIEVEFNNAPGNQIQKWEQVITRVAGGVSPDIVGAVSVEFVQYAANGLIQPVDPYILRDKANVGAIIPILTSSLKWLGSQYMMPYGASGLPLAYNTQLFDQAGLARPPARWNSANWTWETFVTDMVKLTKRDSSGRTTQIGLAGPYMDSWITLPYNWGGDWIDATMTRFTGDEPGALAALQSLQDLRWKYQVMPRPGESAGGSSGFLNGTAAMEGWGTWSLQSLIASDNSYSLAPWFRVGNNPPKGPINPMGLAMLSSAKHKEEAWEFIKFATLDPVGNFLFAQAAGAVPGTAQAYRQWQETIEAQSPGLNVGAFVEQVAQYPAIVNIRKTTTFNEINAVMSSAVASVINNDKSPSQAMEQVAEVVQGLIDMSEH